MNEQEQKIKELENKINEFDTSLLDFKILFDSHFHDGNNSSKINAVDLVSFGALSTPLTTGTMSVPMNCKILNITPTGDCTFNADKSKGNVGDIVVFYITTTGTSSRTLTWGTNFKTMGTLATGTTSARYFTITFVCVDSSLWVETGRTTAMV
jgi:hypothetical protein